MAHPQHLTAGGNVLMSVSVPFPSLLPCPGFPNNLLHRIPIFLSFFLSIPLGWGDAPGGISVSPPFDPNPLPPCSLPAVPRGWAMEGTALLLTDDNITYLHPLLGWGTASKINLIPHIEADRPRNVTQPSVQPGWMWPASSRFLRVLISLTSKHLNQLKPWGLNCWAHHLQRTCLHSKGQKQGMATLAAWEVKQGWHEKGKFGCFLNEAG